MIFLKAGYYNNMYKKLFVQENATKMTHTQYYLSVLTHTQYYMNDFFKSWLL